MSEKNTNQDWDKDKFPTSAKPVFKGVGLLIALLGALCAVVYFSSDYSYLEKEEDKKRDSIASEFLADEQLEE